MQYDGGDGIFRFTWRTGVSVNEPVDKHGVEGMEQDKVIPLS